MAGAEQRTRAGLYNFEPLSGKLARELALRAVWNLNKKKNVCIKEDATRDSSYIESEMEPAL